MPEPVLVSIAAALAAKSVTSLYDLVKARFAKRGEAAAALTAAEGAAPDSPQVVALAGELERAAQEDPHFAQELRSLWGVESSGQQAAHGGVVNQITGNVSGKVLQARDIEGGVSF
ncbi:hypothetical protein V5P93_006338 [Actinokineospora auranticolor]|uniref:Uncharacterized protein n=1 Tax=Actinokineospora auranticolor TaxID=155976 RepID=A0A2S6GFU3_9PSEU|nr:hypothetical protein [Actinokineospora auranticolor]PPK64098.1 hypothetical protein CLV40_12289 [Actinokineospora auranticolor]